MVTEVNRMQPVYRNPFWTGLWPPISSLVDASAPGNVIDCHSLFVAPIHFLPSKSPKNSLLLLGFQALEYLTAASPGR